MDHENLLTEAVSAATGLRPLVGGTTSARDRLRDQGSWWVRPLFQGESGFVYGLRLGLGEGHGSVVRCGRGHAVTVGARPTDALMAALACERVLVGPKARAALVSAWPSVRGAVGELQDTLGGSVERLEEVVSACGELPSWRAPAPPEEELARREALAGLLGDSGLSTGEGAWRHAAAAWRFHRGPEAASAVAVLEGPHGLDGTGAGAGLQPDAELSARFLAACAELAGDLPIARVLRFGELEPAFFEDAILRGPTPEARFEAWMSASFWSFMNRDFAPPEFRLGAARVARDAGNDALAAELL